MDWSYDEAMAAARQREIERMAQALVVLAEAFEPLADALRSVADAVCRFAEMLRPVFDWPFGRRYRCGAGWVSWDGKLQRWRPVERASGALYWASP